MNNCKTALLKKCKNAVLYPNRADGQLLVWRWRMMELTTGIVELRNFLAPLGAENLSEHGKQVEDQKMPETCVNTGFMLFKAEAENLSLSMFEATFLSVFV
ncbi:MAG: hypothetical protein AB1861_22435 [Cyanobacteriota bacterium]